MYGKLKLPESLSRDLTDLKTIKAEIKGSCSVIMCMGCKITGERAACTDRSNDDKWIAMFQLFSPVHGVKW